MPVGDILVRRCCYRVLLAPPVGNSRSYSAPPGRIRANPFGEVPTARGLRRVLEMLELRRNVDTEHELRAKYHRIYGPIYRYRFLGRNVVSVNDAAAVETLHRVDGRCPRRYVPAQWQGWRAERGIPCGILTELVTHHTLSHRYNYIMSRFHEALAPYCDFLTNACIFCMH